MTLLQYMHALEQVHMQQLHKSVTYAESSVMWFSGLFQQFPHKALMISELGLHADALPPTCTDTNK